MADGARAGTRSEVAMADIMSILSSSYVTSSFSPPSKTKYVNVDPALYSGSWAGTYNNGKKFSIQVSSVNGFKAQVKYTSEGTTKYQEVMIKDNSFRIADTKFTLTGKGKANIRTVISNPADGSTTLVTADVTQS
jgi:hypothetical protein